MIPVNGTGAVTESTRVVLWDGSSELTTDDYHYKPQAPRRPRDLLWGGDLAGGGEFVVRSFSA